MINKLIAYLKTLMGIIPTKPEKEEYVAPKATVVAKEEVSAPATAESEKLPPVKKAKKPRAKKAKK